MQRNRPACVRAQQLEPKWIQIVVVAAVLAAVVVAAIVAVEEGASPRMLHDHDGLVMLRVCMGSALSHRCAHIHPNLGWRIGRAHYRDGVDTHETWGANLITCEVCMHCSCRMYPAA